MKILFIGDIVGRPGRTILKERLSSLQESHAVDLTIVNVENAAAGFGITPKLAGHILSLGVDVMTSGNHIWDRREVLDFLDREPRLLRPGNYPPSLPGNFAFMGETRSGIPYSVANIQGRVYMPVIDCPFRFIEQRLDALHRHSAVLLVDLHAEATSEKMAMGWFLDGKVSALLGTHTHVATSDVRILPQGTAYVSDVGMTGAFDSVIGMEVEGSLKRLLTGVSAKFVPAKSRVGLSAVLVDVDEESGRARSIRRCDIEPADS